MATYIGSPLLQEQHLEQRIDRVQQQAGNRDRNVEIHNTTWSPQRVHRKFLNEFCFRYSAYYFCLIDTN
jgi:hypothetical protein